jgi:hypothetical protein
MRQFVFCVTMAGSLVVAMPQHANAGVLSWLGRYLLGRVTDGIWDRMTGKPDVRELDRRLRQVESVLARTEGRGYAQHVRTIRRSVSRDTNPLDYARMVREVVDRIARLERRVGDLESSIGGLQSNVRDFERRLARLETAEFPRFSRSGLNRYASIRRQPCGLRRAINRRRRHAGLAVLPKGHFILD